MKRFIRNKQGTLIPTFFHPTKRTCQCGTPLPHHAGNKVSTMCKVCAGKKLKQP